MLDASLLDGFTVDILRLVAWANVAVAVAVLVAAVFWVVCCELESGQHKRGPRTL